MWSKRTDYLSTDEEDGVEMKQDMVNHPKHFTSDPSGVECIDIVRHRNYNIGNAIKYLWRAGLKNGETHIEDLQKAIFYINDEINRVQGVYDGTQEKGYL